VLANVRRMLGCLRNSGELGSEVHMQPCRDVRSERGCLQLSWSSTPHAITAELSAAVQKAAAAAATDAAKHGRLTRILRVQNNTSRQTLADSVSVSWVDCHKSRALPLK